MLGNTDEIHVDKAVKAVTQHLFVVLMIHRDKETWVSVCKESCACCCSLIHDNVFLSQRSCKVTDVIMWIVCLNLKEGVYVHV